MTEPTLTYEIRIKGHLSRRITSSFAGFNACLLPDGDTLLTGPVEDSAALYGLFSRLRDLGLTLVSARQIDPDTGSTTVEQA